MSERDRQAAGQRAIDAAAEVAVARDYRRNLVSSPYLADLTAASAEEYRAFAREMVGTWWGLVPRGDAPA